MLIGGCESGRAGESGNQAAVADAPRRRGARTIPARRIDQEEAYAVGGRGAVVVGNYGVDAKFSCQPMDGGEM
jgi:hypothetical protein